MNKPYLVFTVIVDVILFSLLGVAFWKVNEVKNTPAPEWYRIVLLQKDALSGSREVILSKTDALSMFDGLVKMRKLCSDQSIAEMRLDRLAQTTDMTRADMQKKAIAEESGIQNILPYEWSTVKHQDSCGGPVGI